MVLSDSLVALIEARLAPQRAGRMLPRETLPLLLELLRIAEGNLPWRAINPSIAQFIGARERFMRWRKRGKLARLVADARSLPSLSTVDCMFLDRLAILETLVSRPRSQPGKTWSERNPRKPYPKDRKRPEKRTVSVPKALSLRKPDTP